MNHGGDTLFSLLLLEEVGMLKHVTMQRRASTLGSHDRGSWIDEDPATVFLNQELRIVAQYSCHSLLKTRFPVPFPEIEAQVGQDGLWEGELVHTCHDQHLVTVECRWSSKRFRSVGASL